MGGQEGESLQRGALNRGGGGGGNEDESILGRQCPPLGTIRIQVLNAEGGNGAYASLNEKKGQGVS